MDKINEMFDLPRTLGIIKEMYEGHRISLKSGGVIGMGEDLTIGYVLFDGDPSKPETKEIGVSSSVDLTVKQLNEIFNKEAGKGYLLPISWIKTRKRT